MKTSHPAVPRNTLNAYRLVLLAVVAAVLTFSVAVFYPANLAADETMSLSFAATYGWLFVQSFVLVVPGLIVGLSMVRWLPRVGATVGAILLFAVPVVVFCDMLTFGLIGERFLSPTMQRIGTTMAPALAFHVTQAMMIDAAIVFVVGAMTIAVGWWLAGKLAVRWAASRDPVGPWLTALILGIVVAVMSLPAVWQLPRTIAEMREQSVRHPFCAFRIVGYRGTGVAVRDGQQATLARLRGLQSAPAVLELDRRQLEVELDPQTVAAIEPRELPDVVVIVAESLRPDVVHPDVMPRLAEFAKRSIHCKKHFSSGNSTNYGMFSLLTGLEAMWFDRPVSQHPILNRIFRQAGYRMAFHGGQDDWRMFQMDGYIAEEHYDQFHIELPDLPTTDLRSVRLSAEFLRAPQVRFPERGPNDNATAADGGSDIDPHAPRLAVTYMFTTHCPYYSVEEDEVFSPAASENFFAPYNAANHEMILNRYKNSARTLDRMIEPLLREDCVVVVVGDHGESFLKDGSAIHGVRISEGQNMTPLIIHYPGVTPRTIEQPTTHCDVLPTLLSILDLPTTDSELFDGLDLTSADEQTLASRIFSSRNLMDHSAGLIGPWTFDPEQPFAYRFFFNIRDWQLNYLNPIDPLGYEREIADANRGQGRRLVADWIEQQFGPEAVRTDRDEQELFTKFFHSPLREIRLAAMRIASDVAQPEPDLYDLIVGAIRDPDPEVRKLARETLIRTERYASQSR